MRTRRNDLDIEKIIRKYRGLILENLYKSDGYDFDRVVSLSDGRYDVIFVIYRKRCKDD